MSRTRVLALFAAVTVLFGTSFPAIKAGLAYLPPLTFAAMRYGVSAAVLLAYVALGADRRRPRTRADGRAVLAGGVFLIGGTGLTFLGQQYTTSGVAAIIVSLTPVVTGLLAWWLLPSERLSRRGALGVVVGFVGAAIVVRPDPSGLLDPELAGKLSILAATCFVTLGSVLIRRSRAHLPPITLTAWSMVVGVGVLLSGALLRGETVDAARVGWEALAAVLYLGVFAGAVGFAAYFTLIETVGALEANLVTYLNPVVAIVVGRAFLGEPVPTTALVGFAVIAAGFALLKERELLAELTKYRGGGR